MNLKRYNSVKRVAFALLYVLIAVMAAATFIEHGRGTQYVVSHIYSSAWFAALWAALAISGLFCLFARKAKLHVYLLHASLVIILAGAMLTSLTAVRGTLHLREGKTVSSYTLDDEGGEEAALPFTITLKSFKTDYHNGTNAASDFVSHFVIKDGGNDISGEVSMNNVFTHRGYRFYQMSYDSDGHGTVLMVSEDFWGMTVTYVGYALLFLSLVWMLVAPSGTFRHLLRSPLLKKSGVLGTFILFGALTSQAAHTVEPVTAEKFGSLYVVYNDRVCPMHTMALDFTRKLCGSAKYGNYTPEQVVLGWLFWPEEWRNEPIFQVKSSALRDELGLDRHSAMSDFFMSGYRLGPYVQAYYNGDKSSLNKDAVELDDRIQLVTSLRRGELFKLFPVNDGGRCVWVTPVEKLPASLSKRDSLFITNVFTVMFQDVSAGNVGRVNLGLDEIKSYQLNHSQGTIPPAYKVKSEELYNAVPLPSILFKVNLTIGILLLVVFTMGLVKGKPIKNFRLMFVGGMWLMGLAFVLLTAYLSLRVVVSGRLPLGNGFETMLIVTWVAMVLTLLMSPRFKILLPLGFVLSGFFMLVSSLSQMNPQITPLMPVLGSPLLSIHVSIIMIAYALLSFTFILSLVALVVRFMGRDMVGEKLQQLQLVSQLLLYPAMTLLGIGIFVGAIWANQSWGRYWGWDPKEVWALITFMFYAIPLHGSLLKPIRKPMNYHYYMIVAFFTVIMTYWGVNYLLGGMHSYAG